MTSKTAAFAAMVTLLTAGAVAFGDGMIVPVRPSLPVRGQWSVKYHHVKITVRDQVASVSIDQEFVNNGRGNLEVEYMFPIPPGAAIDAMTLVVDGKELTGKILEAKEARRIYEDIVRQKKDPALLEYIGYGLYRTRAFPLQPGKPAHVLTHYTTVCRRDHDLVEVFYPLNTEKFSARKIDDVRVTVDIKAKADITAVYSPTHDLSVQRKGPRHVVATYHVKDVVPDIDFQVYYKAKDEKIGATVLTHRPDENSPGYFLALVSPNPKAAARATASKDLVVVLDHSGSMAKDRKLDQAKEALKYVLSSLGEEDRFNVVAFSDTVERFFPELVGASRKHVSEALDLLDRLEATGGTNISGALTTAMELFAEDDRPDYLLFLTDGLPTVGERNEGEILKLTKKANRAHARLFALGVGYDVNARLVDNLVRTHRGVSDYLKPAEPLEAKVSSLYNKIKRPVMTDVTLGFEGVRTSMTYPRDLPDLFDGGQILLVGRYEGGGKTTMTVTGKLGGKKQTFTYPVNLARVSENNRYKFVERLWAVRRVGYLLDQIQLAGETKEVVDELVRLSKKYGIMTPYTAFLADESVKLGKVADIRDLALGAAESLRRARGGYAGQAAAKTRLQLNQATRAPAPSVPARAPGGSVRTQVFGWAHDEAGRRAYEKGARQSVANVQNVGNRTLYRRGKVWFTPDLAELDLEKDADKIKEIKRFSEAYFELVRQNTIEENQILATQQAGEELLIRLRGQVYRIR